MSPHDGAVDEDYFAVSIFTQDGKNVLPDIPVSPAGKATINAVPWTGCCQKISPWAANARYPQHRLNEKAVVRATAAMVASFPCKSVSTRTH